MRYVTVRKFASESGYTEDAIRSKIRDGIWRLGEIWIKAPDSRTLLDVEGYKSWVEVGGSSGGLRYEYRNHVHVSVRPASRADHAQAHRYQSEEIRAA